jgi:DNA (cytosine-5)-methyltransferase 1
MKKDFVAGASNSDVAPVATLGSSSGNTIALDEKLNLYAGLLGNATHWDGEVTNVEQEDSLIAIGKQRRPQDTFVKADAHQYLLENAHRFGFIWSSPPCQTHSRMMKATRHKKPRYTDMSLYQEILFLSHFFKGLWVVENVKPYYEPLIKPTAILGRHYFWSNFHITPFHIEQPKGFITAGTVADTQRLKDWLGIQYEGNIYYKDNHCPGQVLRNCVHPLLGKHILECAKAHQQPQQLKIAI